VEKELGVYIKRERERMGFTLRKLASSIQVSASFLSQVETGKAVPSLATLKKLADALHTTIGKLVGEDKESIDQNPIVIKKKRILIDRMGHGLNIELLANQDVNNMMQPYIVNLKAYGDTGIPNQHAGQECGVVLKGSLKMFLDKEIYILNTGDSFYYKANIPHYFKNTTDRVTTVLFISTPPLF
jgi:transcriptional regulator with XRE-family HTH domain